MENLISVIKNILENLNTLSLLFYIFLFLFFLVLCILILFFILMKIFNIKFIFKSNISSNNPEDSRYEPMFNQFYYQLEQEHEDQRKFNKELYNEFKTKNDGFKNIGRAMIKQIESLKNKIANLENQIENANSKLDVSSKLSDTLKNEIQDKNETIEKFEKGMLASHSKAAISKIILTINGILRDKNLNKEETTIRITELESILSAFNVTRIDVSIGDSFDNTKMKILSVSGSGDELNRKVKEVVEYGYYVDEGSVSKILEFTKVKL